MKMDITAIILTYNEEIHLERCISSVLPIAKKIVVIDSFSTDDTVAIATSLGAEVHQRKWKNYSDQFQWALNNCVNGSECEWIFRIDADEYLEPDLQDEIKSQFKLDMQNDIAGFYITRKIFFNNKWIRHGGFYPHKMLRLWRNGKGRIEQRWMDEHIVLEPDSNTKHLKGHLVDYNLKGITFWVNKHNSYATREMVDMLNIKYNIMSYDNALLDMSDPQAKWRRLLKDKIYAKIPIGIRSTLYFIYRYIFRLGFLDGRNGFVWHFMQGYWYRMLVDVKIDEIETKTRGDVEKIRLLLKKEYGIDLGNN